MTGAGIWVGIGVKKGVGIGSMKGMGATGVMHPRFRVFVWCRACRSSSLAMSSTAMHSASVGAHWAILV